MQNAPEMMGEIAKLTQYRAGVVSKNAVTGVRVVDGA
jgi:hypothetical protein